MSDPFLLKNRWSAKASRSFAVVWTKAPAFVGVPQWMFDPAICSMLRVHPDPSVSVQALRSLMDLLRETNGIADQSSPGHVQEHKYFQTDIGDATHANGESEKATQSIHKATSSSSLESPSGDNKTRSSKETGKADA